MSPLSQPINTSKVLTKASWKAAELLGLKPEQFVRILHLECVDMNLSEATLMLDPNSKQGEIALILIRIYKALYHLNGGDIEWMHHFLNSPNRILLIHINLITASLQRSLCQSQPTMY